MTATIERPALDWGNVDMDRYEAGVQAAVDWEGPVPDPGNQSRTDPWFCLGMQEMMRVKAGVTPAFAVSGATRDDAYLSFSRN